MSGDSATGIHYEPLTVDITIMLSNLTQQHLVKVYKNKSSHTFYTLI